MSMTRVWKAPVEAWMIRRRPTPAIETPASSLQPGGKLTRRFGSHPLPSVQSCVDSRRHQTPHDDSYGLARRTPLLRFTLSTGRRPEFVAATAQRNWHKWLSQIQEPICGSSTSSGSHPKGQGVGDVPKEGLCGILADHGRLPRPWTRRIAPSVGPDSVAGARRTDRLASGPAPDHSAV